MLLRFLTAAILIAGLSFPASAQDIVTLPGTRPLVETEDLSQKNLKLVDRYLLKLVNEARTKREQHWKRDYSSVGAYRASVQTMRDKLKRRIGAVDERVAPKDLQILSSLESPALVSENEYVKVLSVRWSVFDDVQAEGLLLEPKGKVLAQVVVVPDADTHPEQLARLALEIKAQNGYARRLAEAGCRVLIPTLIDRNTQWSGNPRVRMLNQTHREFLYRQAFFMGRHQIGYEVQSVLAAVDYFHFWSKWNKNDLPIGVAGYAEGGLLAFYAAALDERIDAALVSGYFQPREVMPAEPVYRNIYGLLREFGDAEIASLVAPRGLIIEACRVPVTPDPPPPIKGRNSAAYGRLTTPALEAVQSEFAKAERHYRELKVPGSIQLIKSDNGNGLAMSDDALRVFYKTLTGKEELPTKRGRPLHDHRNGFTAPKRLKRLFDQWVEHTQRIARQSPFKRAEFWKEADKSSVKKWQESTRAYRDLLWDEVIGKLPKASMKPNPRTRKIYETPKWTGYEVVLDVYPEVLTYGIILVPKDLKPNEKRPVVVAQHGRNGTPQVICTPDEDTRAYHSYGAKLADAGYIVYAPQNLYLGEEHYRTAQRKAFALGMTIFAPMIRQHEQTLSWLGSLPFVDADKIAFYGLSYGGKSAMLIPAVLEGYCLSICSGDFNEQIWKHTSIEDRYSFMFTLEHEHTEFDFGERFNYAEIAGLIAPRPFMVERGHRDGVAPDEWVAYEYAKVRRLFVELGIPERTEIEFFNGVHEIRLEGTLEFLEKHLK